MDSRRRLFFAVVIMIFVLSLMYYASVNQKIKTVCINKKCFNVEVAKTPTEMTRGLSNRIFLNSDDGMLFVFDAENIPYFWMKDMQFPLDIIWINQNMKIIGVEKKLQPCNPSYCGLFKPNSKVKYVMEINGNQSEQYNFKAGDFVNFGKA